MEPVVERYRERNLRRYFRGDAAFASPDIYEFLEGEGFLYAIRLPKNQILQESIGHLLTRPVGRPPKMIILDMDSSVSPTHGEQEGAAYNGHFGCCCYHPLFLFNQFGDLERCSLRPGNVHSADG